MNKVVVIMPTFNEAKNIGGMIEKLVDKEFPKIKNAQMHLLVVNDLSKGKDDGTGDIVRQAIKSRKNIHILEDEKRGLGWAYIRGMKYAVKTLHADAVMEMDADGQHPPEFVAPMVQSFLDGADYAIGSRYIPGGSVPKEWPVFRRAVSFFGNLFIRVVLLKPRLHDLTTGFRLTRVEGVLDKIDLDKLMEPSRFAYKVDLLYQSVKSAKKVVEVPLEFRPRVEEASKFSTKEMISTFKVAIILGIKDKQKFFKFGTVGFIGYIVNALGIYFFARLGWAEWMIWAVATELAIISNFTLNNIWTFKAEKITGFIRLINKFVQFNLTSTGALVIQTVVGTLGVNAFGPRYRQILLPFIVVFLILPYNYLMYNLVIWRSWKLPRFFKK
ncbi:MAG: Glycosyl transferase family 2 [Candidatus Woesebacteria bacterium GW2011_GWB1_43_14]|uniref:Glycosyl transferase family 2 n=1 Tax=Candidatus Woesebacteria bacterium GW2011_GWB1_43_14 TaxID=1618578 RepID=A0A0G1GEI6_9BACT|nr:MAG: Glycosyl transferase family 2 [Candidatus Woesebacteria bacterium GW2011_GWA1_39_11b]KKS78304.1 MAG: Glycosyl transferase family 2 [Candidatus Woesebacteria bacterium GW2011_GWC1_42_9]KKS97278.1 MAG: Glycosyl transferase family 2 [Candidatus Woesebacteria bacterium GW2011_GWB1_43_14]